MISPRATKPGCRSCAVYPLPSRRGEIVAILGPNGAGKSTLIKAILGLVPKWSGTVTLDGLDITTLAAHAMVRHGVAFVPQTENVFASMTVNDNLALADGDPAAGPARAANRGGASTCFLIWPPGGRLWPAGCPAASGRCWRSSVP